MAPKKKGTAGKRKNTKKPSAAAAAVKKGFVDDINRDLLKACSNPEPEGLMPVELLKLAKKFSSLKGLIPKCKLRIEKAINKRFQSALEILPAILDEKDKDFMELKKCAVAKITRHPNIKELLECAELQKLPLKAFREILKEGLAITIEHLKGPINQWAKCQIHRRNEEEFPDGGEIVQIPVEDVAGEIYGAIQGLRFPNISLQDLIRMFECNDDAKWEVDSAEVVLKEEIDIDNKNFLDFSAIDNNVTNGDEQRGIAESPGPLAVDVVVSDNPGAGNGKNAQNNNEDNEEGDLERSSEAITLNEYQRNQQRSSDETLPEPPNTEADSFMELELRREDYRETSTAGGGDCVDGGADLGSIDEGRIKQPIKTEDEKFYIKLDDDSDSCEGDDNVLISDLSESAKTRKRSKSKVAIPEIPISNAASQCAVNEEKIDRTADQKRSKTTPSKSSSFRLKSVFVSLNRLSAAQILSIKNKMGVKSKAKWKCLHCPKIFSCKSRQTEHTRSHTGERPFRCPHCPYASSRAQNLRRHIRRIHSPENMSSICRICQHKFPSRRILSAHIKTHLKCYFCSRTVKRFRDMQRHLVTHTGEKPLSCPHCQYATAHTYQLKKHIRIKHTSSAKSEMSLKPGYLKCPLLYKGR